MSNLDQLIHVRDSLDETIDALEEAENYEPQPVTIDEHGTYRFRANPIVQYLLSTHQYEEMDTISNTFRDDRTALVQFEQLIGCSVGAVDGAQGEAAHQTAKLMAENERLKAELKDRVHLHSQLASAAQGLRSQVEELKAAQTPRPMSEAPRTGRILLATEIQYEGQGRGCWEDNDGTPVDVDIADGWLPLPMDQGERS